MFSWGCYLLLLAVVETPLGSATGAVGLARLTGLLGGFALAVAGLLALAGTGVAHPATRGVPSAPRVGV
jgi:hypothetical protein